MAYTQDDLARLQAAIAKGASEVQMGGERVKFRDLDAMLRTERRIKSELGLGGPVRRMHKPKTSTGFR